MPDRTFFVYILASHTRVLYIGMTSRLAQRLMQHRSNVPSSFTSRYRVHRLVHCEVFAEATLAIRRERELKKWRREKKIALIREQNPLWKDLATEWRLE